MSFVVVLLFQFAAVPALVAALEWTQQPGYRSAPVAAGHDRQGGIREARTAKHRSEFHECDSAERHYANQILLNGSGVAAGDVDGDGWCDLFFCGVGGPKRAVSQSG